MSQIFVRRFHLDIPRHPVTVAFVKGLGRDPLVTGGFTKDSAKLYPIASIRGIFTYIWLMFGKCR